jgi:hypothetical protein
MGGERRGEETLLEKDVERKEKKRRKEKDIQSDMWVPCIGDVYW